MSILQPEEPSELKRREASEIEPDQYQSRLYYDELDEQYVLDKGSEADAVRAPGARGADHCGARGDRANCQESSGSGSRRSSELPGVVKMWFQEIGAEKQNVEDVAIGRLERGESRADDEVMAAPRCEVGESDGHGVGWTSRLRC
mmetsp:Transcript_34605/g.112554  ORF Transcript_34605/g.112554 Transcript_34605/m.112554 type:complete len:145 (+) Transcript_34605:839-1273(+)